MKIEYIDNINLLQKCVLHLKSQKIIALDIEFDNNHFHYGFKLCLIQVASQERCFVIDPYRVKVNPLFEIFENPDIQKVLHSPGEDLRLLQILGCFAKNIFDTNSACQLLNHPMLSLDKMIYYTLNVVIDKQAQNSDWTLRPLTRQQIMYAGNDVIYLIDAKMALEKEIHKKNISQWLQEENAYYDEITFSPIPHPFDEKYLGKEEDKYYSPYDFYVLLEILKFREQKAMDLDKPAHQVFSRDVAKTLAFSPKKGNDFLQTRGITKYIKDIETENDFIALVENAHQYATEHNLSKEIQKDKKKYAENNNPQNPQQDINEQENTEEISNENTLTDNTEPTKRHRRFHKDIEKILQNIFLPIQKALIDELGEQVARKVFSTTTAREIASGHASLNGIKFQYKKNLIINTAQKLGIDLDGF